MRTTGLPLCVNGQEKLELRQSGTSLWLDVDNNHTFFGEAESKADQLRVLVSFFRAGLEAIHKQNDLQSLEWRRGYVAGLGAARDLTRSVSRTIFTGPDGKEVPSVHT